MGPGVGSLGPALPEEVGGGGDAAGAVPGGDHTVHRTPRHQSALQEEEVVQLSRADGAGHGGAAVASPLQDERRR